MATPSLDSARAAAFSAIEKTPEFRPEALPGRKLSLVGLTRDALKARLIEAGVPERESRMRSARSGTGSTCAGRRTSPR